MIKGQLTPAQLVNATGKWLPVADQARDLAKQADHAYKLFTRLLDICEYQLNARDNDEWNPREITRSRKAFDEHRHALAQQLREVRYYQRQAAWLTDRFPNGTLVDVPGLVMLADKKDIEQHEWSLTLGRYVGVAPEEVDEDFDFEESIKDIHIELEGLNEEAAALASTISKNFRELIG